MNLRETILTSEVSCIHVKLSWLIAVSNDTNTIKYELGWVELCRPLCLVVTLTKLALCDCA
jgi:hypothetical protein